MNLDRARAVADAVLYEGYLLYPYRADSDKNRSRWQFGVLGPPGAAEAGCGEESVVSSQFLLRATGRADRPVLTAYLRFLQLQHRSVRTPGPDGTLREVAELTVAGRQWLSWDEAVEREITLGPWPLDRCATAAGDGFAAELDVPGGEEVEELRAADGAVAGLLVRHREPLRLRARLDVDPVDQGSGLLRLSLRVANTTTGVPPHKDRAIAASFIGAHVLAAVTDGAFVSMTDPPADAAGHAATCAQHRCWPVLAGPEGDDSLLLISPIILYDHPELAPQSAGALFDSTEIDEILTLRVLTLTDEEKATARATDPRAAEIIDRCEAMSPDEMRLLHGVLRDPHAAGPIGEFAAGPIGEFAEGPVGGFAAGPGLAEVDLSGTFGFDGEAPWWDPAVDGSVSPETDRIVVDGISVAKGSTVRLRPSRRADAQDVFFAGQLARVTAVHSDVDGATHVAVILLDDPAADLHEWYGRYLYFAPEEIVPVPPEPDDARPGAAGNRKESQS